jgi:hypothetical protein
MKPAILIIMVFGGHIDGAPPDHWRGEKYHIDDQTLMTMDHCYKSAAEINMRSTTIEGMPMAVCAPAAT